MHCHGSHDDMLIGAQDSIALVGHPNVGKSVIFHRLTGQRVTIANYPGTTIEVTRGTSRVIPGTTLIDTPGVVAFPPQSEDECVTTQVLLHEPMKAILQVGDAKNLRRTLYLTIQLSEMGLPLVLALNMMDEADKRGVLIDHNKLSEYLSLPVIPITAVRGQGIDALTETIQTALPPNLRLKYPDEIEMALVQICTSLPHSHISSRAIALLWLSDDPVTDAWLRSNLDPGLFQNLVERKEYLQLSFPKPIAFVIQQVRQEFIERITPTVIIEEGSGWRGLSAILGYLTTHPLWGLPILMLVLFTLYWFVGIFGAGTIVGFLEEHLFGEVLNPWVIQWVNRLVPIQLLKDLLVGEYGLWTMGMTYALALILPIVTTFFLAFGIMEDSGYLPRLAVLSNRIFQGLGLNGKAVLPMVLGLGCVTMATLTTRVLESKRERILVTMLLALAVPCSAQLGVVMGMLAGISFVATLIWSSVVIIVMLAIGWLAARLMPGERNQLLVELPPLRFPMISNVLLKTLARLEWYLREVIPLFLAGTTIMFLLDRAGILELLIQASEPLVAGWLGLPAEASAAFLMGFLRRDFGATGLFVMEAQGLLTPLQVVVAMVTVTLFIPCIASVMMIAKEQDWRIAVGVITLIIPLAFLVGGVLNWALLAIGWGV